MSSYAKFFATENTAIARAAMKNRACKRAGNYKDIYAVVDGPCDDYAVVDLNTAINLGSGYFIAD